MQTGGIAGNIKGRIRAERVLLVLIVLAAAAVRAPALFWGGPLPHSRDSIVRTDEANHYTLGVAYLDGHHPEARYYFKATGIQMVAASKLASRCLGLLKVSHYTKPGRWEATVAGRVLSIAYACLTIVIINSMTCRWLGKGRALLASLFLAFSNLHVTYSHFALPDIPGVFWLYLALFLLMLSVEKGRPGYLAAASFVSGIAFGTKYLGMPLVAALGVALWGRRKVLKLAAVVAAFFLGFLLANGFRISGDFCKEIVEMLFKDNLELDLEKSRAWNVPIYLLELAVGMGLGSFVPLVITGVRTAVRPRFLRLPRSLVVIVPLAIYGLMVLALDVPFARHLLPLVPAACMAAAAALAPRERGPGGWRAVAAACCVGYSLLAVISAERPFVRDPRRDCLAWMERTIPEGTLVSSDVNFPLPRDRYRIADFGSTEARVIAVHEAEYFRYLRSILNPLRPPSTQRVYHRTKERELTLLMQGLLELRPYDPASDFRQVAKFGLGPLVPEALIFEKLWGSFNTKAGRILVFRKDE